MAEATEENTTRFFEAIAAAIDTGRVVINPLIYAEVSVGYRTVEELEELRPAADYEREPLPYIAGLPRERHSSGTDAAAVKSGRRCPAS